MTDIVPEPISPPLAEIPAPGQGAAPEAPRRAWRLVKSPLLRISAAVAGLALGWGAFQAAATLRQIASTIKFG